MIQVEIEAAAVRHVADRSFLLDIELERVVLTPSGVLLGCWQVLSLLFLFSTSNYLAMRSLVSFPCPITSKKFKKNLRLKCNEVIFRFDGPWGIELSLCDFCKFLQLSCLVSSNI